MTESAPSYFVPTTAADLDELVSSHADENSNLEFKSSRAFQDKTKFRSELPRDVSAFANAGGGVMIVGIEENDKNQAERVVGYVGADLDVSWFEDVLLRNVTPRLPGLRAHLINHLSGSVFVLHAPPSNLAPHQCSDGKFYARRQFRRDVLERFEIDLLRLRGQKNSTGIFGGIVIQRYNVVAVVENASDQPILEVRLQLNSQLSSVPCDLPKIFCGGIGVVPARSNIKIDLGMASELVSHPFWSSDIQYEFLYRFEGGSREEGLKGRIHLAELRDTAIEQADVEKIVSAIRQGFSNLASEFGKRR